MSDWPQSFAETVQPLATTGLTEAGVEAAQKLADQGYAVYEGLTPEYADAIAAMAQEPALREYVPKDHSERFANRIATEHWLTKGRASFLLLKHRDDGSLSLAGYGWAGPGSTALVPGGQTTFAVRIGEADQGKGLATSFTRLVVEGAVIGYGARDVWLETWGSNAAAVHIYHKIGAELVTERSDMRPTSTGGTVPDTRLFMSLANDLLPTASA